MGAPQQRRHHLDAGQVGVSLVCRVGPGVSLLPLALVDAEFAKEQLVLLTREWYMHPNGQMPAYEWAFGDVNPPVHAWATWRVFQMDRKQRGDDGDLRFLERVFHKLLLNFTWWVNRKDAEGRNIFQGGFLGLDNIGVFDRSAPLPTGGHIDQADGTSWMAMYCAQSHAHRAGAGAAQQRVRRRRDQVLRTLPAHRRSDEQDRRQERRRPLGRHRTSSTTTCCTLPTAQTMPLKVRSMVGLIPLIRGGDARAGIAGARARVHGAAGVVPELPPRPREAGLALGRAWPGKRRLLSLLRGHRMKKLLARMLDQTEFLSEYGVRALSQVTTRPSVRVRRATAPTDVHYQPAESDLGPVRRQFQLARPDLVPGELPDHRVAAEISSLLRRRFSGRMPDRLGPAAHHRADRG